MKGLRRLFALGALGCALVTPALAAFPDIALDRVVRVKEVSAKAEALLFQMAYAALPVCQRSRSDWTWSFGPLPTTIPLKRQSDDDWDQQIRDTIAVHFRATSGASIFLSELERTPWGYAGIKTNEVLRFKHLADPSVRLQGLQPSSDAAALASVDAENRANPFFKFDLTRADGSSEAIVVRRVPVCKIALQVVDSTFRYAEATTDAVIVTVPFLELLTHDELVAVMAHEVAHASLKLGQWQSRDRFIKNFFLGPLLIRAADAISTNHETETSEPHPSLLIQADQLAMHLAAGFGVDVPTYMGIMQKLALEPASFRSPTYGRTRGVGAERKAELERSADLWRTEKKLVAVTGVEPDISQQLLALASQVRVEPEKLFGTRKTALRGSIDDAGSAAVAVLATSPIPAANLAPTLRQLHTESPDIRDVASVPFLGEAGRGAYLKYLDLKSPRAFAVSTTGAFASASGTFHGNALVKQEPADVSLARCASAARRPCKLYSIDQRVVWDFAPANRAPGQIPNSSLIASSASIAASGFANINDVDAIPYISDERREIYRKYLYFQGPRAYAISSGGASAHAFGTKPADETMSRDPAERAVTSCNTQKRGTCRLYAVNGVVVWDGPAVVPNMPADQQSTAAVPVLHQDPTRVSGAQPMIASGFANINDVDAIPYVNDRARERYRDWLTQPTPRAMAIAATGSYALSSGLNPKDESLPSDPSQRALLVCNRTSKSPCTLYAVNGSVVWVKFSADPAPPLKPVKMPSTP